MILGPSGQVGYELAALARDKFDVSTVGRSSAEHSLIDHEIDVTDYEQLKMVFEQVKPDIVINAIAYTAVDRAETDFEQAFYLNADLPSNLADLCSQTNCLLIHYSTDFVFNGQNQIPWLEDDVTNPINMYGKTKLAGEKAVQISTCPYFILRTSWVYGDRGNNFVLTMLRLAREREALSIVADQIGSPTCSRDIALATIQLCELYKSAPIEVQSKRGLYHLTSTGSCSWHEFAKTIFSLAKQHETLKIQSLSAISSDEYPTDAQRPAYSVLDCSKINETFKLQLPEWPIALEACIKSVYESDSK